MFFRKEEDTKNIYKMRIIAILLSLIPFIGSLTIAFRSSFPNFVFILNPSSPVAYQILCFFYPQGFRLSHLLAPFTSFAVFLTSTLFSLLVLGIYIISWILFLVLSWDFLFIKLLMDVEGYEQYGKVRNFIHTLITRGKAEEKLCVLLEPILSSLGFVISTGIPLSFILLLDETTRLTLPLWLFFVIFLYAANTSYLKKFVKNRVHANKNHTHQE